MTTMVGSLLLAVSVKRATNGKIYDASITRRYPVLISSLYPVTQGQLYYFPVVCKTGEVNMYISDIFIR